MGSGQIKLQYNFYVIAAGNVLCVCVCKREGERKRGTQRGRGRERDREERGEIERDTKRENRNFCCR